MLHHVIWENMIVFTIIYILSYNMLFNIFNYINYNIYDWMNHKLSETFFLIFKYYINSDSENNFIKFFDSSSQFYNYIKYSFRREELNNFYTYYIWFPISSCVRVIVNLAGGSQDLCQSNQTVILSHAHCMDSECTERLKIRSWIAFLRQLRSLVKNQCSSILYTRGFLSLR